MIAAEAAVLRSAMAMDCIATWNLEVVLVPVLLEYEYSNPYMYLYLVDGRSAYN